MRALAPTRHPAFPAPTLLCFRLGSCNPPMQSPPKGGLLCLVLTGKENRFGFPKLIHELLQFRVSGLFSSLPTRPLSSLFPDLLQRLLVHVFPLPLGSDPMPDR